ncbi:MAG: hypothetical protein QXO71_07595 [Candidatus Jordarchaeaceae archaeon]
MSAKIDPFIDALFIGTVISALDKLGVNPMLMIRQATSIIASAEASLKGKVDEKPPSLAKNIEEFCKICTELFRPTQTADPDKSEISYSNGIINMKLVDCAYLTMADLGKKLGYKACPLCMQAFMLASTTRSAKIAEVENFQVENNGDTCIAKLKLLEK